MTQRQGSLLVKSGYFTDLAGNPVLPALTGTPKDDEFCYMAALLIYDVPAEHIMAPGIKNSCGKDNRRKNAANNPCDNCTVLCRQKLKSMRNRLNYWLRKHATRVTDSEYMLPQRSPDEFKQLVDEFDAEFVDGYVKQYHAWGLLANLHWYKVVLSAVGAVSKASQTLKTLHKNVEDILASVEQGIRWDENFKSAATFKQNVAIYGKDEKAKALHMTTVKSWQSKFKSYADVLADFLNMDTAAESGLGNAQVVQQKLNSAGKRIEQALRIAQGEVK